MGLLNSRFTNPTHNSQFTTHNSQKGWALGKKLDTIIDKRIHLLAFQHALVEFGQAQ